MKKRKEILDEVMEVLNAQKTIKIESGSEHTDAVTKMMLNKQVESLKEKVMTLYD